MNNEHEQLFFALSKLINIKFFFETKVPSTLDYQERQTQWTGQVEPGHRLLSVPHHCCRSKACITHRVSYRNL